MAVASAAASLWRQRPARPGASWIAAAVAVGLHGLVAASIVGIDPTRFHADAPIVIEIQEPPPPEIKPPAPEPPPPPPQPRPRPMARLTATPQPASPPPAPPPPNQETPPKTEEAPPIFGGTLSSVVSGGTSEVAVPIGNTLMTKPSGSRGGDAKPYGSDGTHPFTPVADIYIAKYPELLFAPDSPDEIYPPEAKRMGIEGVVRFKLGIDEKGNVVRVKVVERAGHGFDERATRAMWRAKFKPAIGSDGRPVPCTHIWGYRFELSQ